MTKVTFRSDAPSDVGKTFRGKKIVSVKKIIRKRSSGSKSKPTIPTPGPNQFIVRDSKGNFVRLGTFGESPRDVLLKKRADLVKAKQLKEAKAKTDRLERIVLQKKQSQTFQNLIKFKKQIESNSKINILDEENIRRELLGIRSDAQTKVNLNRLINSTKSFRDLINKGYSESVAQTILQFRENKQFYETVKKNPQLLEDQLKLITDFTKKKVGKNTFIDKTKNLDFQTQDRIFRSSVNLASEQVGLPELPINSNISKFNTRANIINKKIELSIKTKKDLIKLTTLTKPNFEKLQDKVRTKQSMTPQEMTIYFNGIKKFNNQLTKKQLFLARDLLALPFNYGRSLANRSNQGIKNPLFNDLKAISKGALKEVGDVINSVLGVKGITINSKGDSFDGIVAFTARKFIDYGQKLAKNEIGGKSYYNTLKSDILKTYKISKTAGKASIDVANFIFKHPVATALLIGIAIEAGVISSQKSFLKNPRENTGRMLTWVFGGKAVKTISKAIRKGKVFQPVEKYSKNNFNASTNLVDGRTKILGSSKGIFDTGEKFDLSYKLLFNPKKKLWNVNVTTKSGKKTFTETYTLVEKQGYYIDPKTKIKHGKIRAVIDKQNIKIKEQTIRPIKNKVNIVADKVYITKQFSVSTITTKIINNVKTITTRVSEVSITTNQTTKKIVLGLSKQFSKATKKTKTTLTKGLSQSQIKQLESFLKDIQYDKVLLNGMDKRTRMARALGLRKESKLIRDIESIIDSKGKVKAIVRTGKAIIKGTFEKGIKPIKKVPKIKRRRRVTSLRKTKKGNYNITGQQKTEVIITQKKTNIPTKKIFELPDIKAKLPLTKVNIKLYGIGNNISRMIKLLNQVIKNSHSLKNLNKNSGLLKQVLRERLTIQEKITLKETKKQIKTKIKQTIKLKEVPKLKIIKKITPITTKKIIVPRIKPRAQIKPPKKPLKKPPITLSIPKKLPRTTKKRQGYLIKIKKGNKVLGVTKQLLPFKRAKNFARKTTDNTIGASHTIIKKGLTNIKDVNKLQRSKKFRPKKSKSKLVQKEVEKRKFRLDNKKERKGLKKNGKRKPTSKPKRNKKKKAIKVSTKKKKSSRKGSKKKRSFRKSSKKKKVFRKSTKKKTKK